METITSVEIDRTEKKVVIHLTNNEFIKIWPFGKTYYSVVSDGVPKSVFSSIAAEINKSSYFKEVTIDSIKTLEEHLQKYINKKVKTIYEI